MDVRSGAKKEYCVRLLRGEPVHRKDSEVEEKIFCLYVQTEETTTSDFVQREGC